LTPTSPNNHLIFSGYISQAGRLVILLFSLLFFNSTANADKVPETTDTQNEEHELFLTAYFLSAHWTKNDGTGEEYNETHKAYGLEYIYKDTYSLSYNHFINSRGNDIDVVGAGYLYDLYDDSFGLHLIGGYQKGYCFEGFLNSEECIEGKDNTSTFFLPMLYYKHQYFMVDFFTNTDMVAFRINIKIYDLFSF